MNFSKQSLYKFAPGVVAIILFFAVSASYFAPQFSGEVLPQHDVIQYEGMTKDIKTNRAAVGEDPQWTGGMFGGMPAYLINVLYPSQIVKNYVGQLVNVVDTPAAFVFFSMLSMWVMLLIMGVNPWVGIISALAYGLSTYFMLIIGAGHITKMWAVVYIPMMMGGAYMTLRGNMWLGASLTALFTSLEVGANHPQITYYFILAMAIFWVSELVISYREKLIKPFVRRTLLLAGAGILGVGSNFSPLWYTLQHTPETMRGGSELVAEGAAEGQSGLDLDYATAWSYGQAESFNMLIPDFMGRQSATVFSTDGEVATSLQELGLQDFAQQLPMYWGDQPYTGGPTYLGAVAILLAAIGIGLSRGRNRWWIIGASVVALFLAWGYNMMWFTELAFNYLPGYNKFRTVSTILVVVQWTVPLLGAYGLSRLWESREEDKKQQLKVLLWSTSVVGGLCLLFMVAGSVFFDFGRADAIELMTQQFHRILSSNNMTNEIAQGMDISLGQSVGTAMANERMDFMSSDAMRSLIFILLTAGVVALFVVKKINKYIMIAAIAVLMVADLIPVNQRFISQDNFVSPRQQQVVASPADQAIMADKDLGYRVLNRSVSTFNDATTSHFHRSVGGYHGAKLSRYQDIIDMYLSKGDAGVLDMLNTRYIINSPEQGAKGVVRRPTANGAAWFVEGLVRVGSPMEEIEAVGGLDLKRMAVVSDDFEVADIVGGGEINLVEYRPNYLKYDYSSLSGGVAVFSEIYYNKGWSAYIDGESAPYIRANYILRAMELPAGDHSVEWRFKAPSWGVVEAITLCCSLVILIGFVAAVACYFYRRKKE